jgi:hypothetical protein
MQEQEVTVTDVVEQDTYHEADDRQDIFSNAVARYVKIDKMAKAKLAKEVADKKIRRAKNKLARKARKLN